MIYHQDVFTCFPVEPVQFILTNLRSRFSFIISNYPTANPLLSVGTFVSSSNTPAQGYHVVFDKSGGGSFFTTLSSAAPIISTQDRVQTLASPQDVDMGGVKLTTNALSVTMTAAGYILDRVTYSSSKRQQQLTYHAGVLLFLTSTCFCSSSILGQ